MPPPISRPNRGEAFGPQQICEDATRRIELRYILLIYSTEGPDGLSPEEEAPIRAGHRSVMEVAGSLGCIEIRPMRFQHSAAGPEGGGLKAALNG